MISEGVDGCDGCLGVAPARTHACSHLVLEVALDALLRGALVESGGAWQARIDVMRVVQLG